MTVKELINKLLDCSMHKGVMIDYPFEHNHEVGNYYKYKEATNFRIIECPHGIIIGIEDDNK